MMTDEEKIKLAKEAVNNKFNCNGKYKCMSYEYCVFGSGCNRSYDCCECGADDFCEGFLEGLETTLKVLENGKVAG